MGTDKPDRADQDIAASRRRQAYWRNRRTVEKLAREGSKLAVDRMSPEALWRVLEMNLLELTRALEDGASPSNYAMARTAWEAYAELMLRGDQLTLFPVKEK